MVDREYPGQEGFTSHPRVENAAKTVDPRRLDDEVSLVEIASVLLRQRRVVLWAILLCTGVSLGIALKRPALYTSSASFLPESTGGVAPSGALALAQQFGFALGSGRGGERSPQFYADLVTSREILRQATTRHFLRPTEGASEEMDLITFYEVGGETVEERIGRAITRLIGALSVSTDRETGIVSFSVTTSDPMVSQALAALILELVNDFDVTTRQSQAGAERLFAGGRLAQLNSELREAEDSFKNFLLENRLFTNSPSLEFEHDRLQRAVAMRQQLVTSLAEAFESARIEEVRNTPVITLIESPRVPALRDPKRRVVIVLVGMSIGAMFGVFLAFVMNYREEDRMRDSSQLDELSSLWSEAVSDLPRFLRRPFKRSAG